MGWVVGTVRDGKIGTLTPSQIDAFQNGFKYSEGTNDVFKKLAKLKITVVFSNAGEITFKHGAKVVGVVGTRITAGRLMKYAGQVGLKVGGRAVGVVFLVSAGNQAVADGGDMDDVAKAVAREAVMADVMEGGVKLVVVDGVGNYVKQKFYGETYLKRYLDADISDVDKSNVKYYWGRHPFLKAFEGN